MKDIYSLALAGLAHIPHVAQLANRNHRRHAGDCEQQNVICGDGVDAEACANDKEYDRSNEVHGSDSLNLLFGSRGELGDLAGKIPVQHPASALQLIRTLTKKRYRFDQALIGVHGLGRLQFGPLVEEGVREHVDPLHSAMRFALYRHRQLCRGGAVAVSHIPEVAGGSAALPCEYLPLFSGEPGVVRFEVHPRITSNDEQYVNIIR